MTDTDLYRRIYTAETALRKTQTDAAAQICLAADIIRTLEKEKTALEEHITTLTEENERLKSLTQTGEPAHE